MELPLTGIEQIDEEHYRLAVTIFAIKALDDPDNLGKLVRNFANEVIKHFTTENNLMERYFYPGYKKHYDIHLNKIKELIFMENIDDNLIPWFINHIKEHDIPLANYLLCYGKNI